MSFRRYSARIPRLALVCAACGFANLSAEADGFEFREDAGRIIITHNSRPFIEYVYVDPEITRPYFTRAHTPGGVQITRNHPPVEGEDSQDHTTYHPGIWLAFGDLDGADFWRNRDAVHHEEFSVAPVADGDRASFTVTNAYRSDGELICREECRYTFVATPSAFFLLTDSRFSNADRSFAFNDQEEMGLGIRVATILTVDRGQGWAVNSAGGKNESGAWGKTADWAAYLGRSDAIHLCALIAPHPENFRPSWFHVRDYGLIIANPFGRKAYTGGAESRISVPRGEEFRLRYGVALASGDSAKDVSPESLYETYLSLIAKED